jgi:cell division protein FtsN
MTAAGQRGRGQPGATRWVALGVVLLVIVGLTFGLGVLVGWHRARQPHQAVSAESSHKPTSPRRRGGLTEAGGERPPQLQEKLTFYQTLKAPLGPVQGLDKGNAAKPAKVSVNPAKGPERASEGTLPRMTDQETPRPTSVHSSTVERQEATAEWTVQVGVFSTPQQAAGVRRQLAERGFEAQIAPIAADDGQLRYRVLVGAFRSKEEAVQTAERVRSDRSLPTYVTTR